MTRSRSFMSSFILTLGAILGSVCLVWTLGLALLGITPLIILSGSMSPALQTGDLAFAQSVSASEIDPGDIVSVTSQDGVRVTHRVVTAEPVESQAALTLKGDANPTTDTETYVVDSALSVVAQVPGAGYFLKLVGTPWAIGAAIAILAACLVIGWRSRSTEPDDSSAQQPRLSRHSLRFLAALGLVPLLTIGSATAPQNTIAYFTDSPTVTTPMDGVDAAPFFTCGQATTPNTLQPLIYYPLNELAGSAIALDLSGNGYNAGIIGDGLEFGRDQPCNRDLDTGLWLAGTNGSIASPNLGSVAGPTGNHWNTVTVSLWFRSGSTTLGGVLIGLNRYRAAGSQSDNDRTIYIDNDGVLRFGVRNGGTFSTLATPLPGSANYEDYRLAEWHMVTASLSSAGVKLYLDGDLLPLTLTEQGEAVSSITTGHQGNDIWVVGNGRSNGEWPGDLSGSNGRWRGEIAKVGIWDRALTDQQIRDLYRSALPINP